MNRFLLLAASVVIASIGIACFTTVAESQPTAKALVVLQPTTPGTAQTGHLNISGTAVAGQFQGGGAGLTSVNADLLDGLNSTAFLQSIPVPLTLSGTSSTHIIQGENASTTSGSTSVRGVASASAGTTYGGYFQSNSTGGRGVQGYASASSGSTNGVFGVSESTDGNGVRGYAGADTGLASGVYGTSSSTIGIGVRGWATSTTGANIGVSGTSSSTNGIGVSGYAAALIGSTTGGLFSSSSSSGAGVRGYVDASSGFTYGGYFQSMSTNGYGVRGNATANTGNTYGGYFECNSTSGRGVFGYAHASSGAAYGVYGQSDSADGIGVRGVIMSSTGTNYGVRGENSSPVGWGVYATGMLGASGTKAFRIDHPFDPENKYLLHYSTESPTPQNFYSGNVTTDARGCAWVDLPEYFSEINVNFKYQLTVVDDSESTTFVQVKIGKKIRGNRFLIMSSAPNVQVSWRVDADRNDLYVRNRPSKDVVDKEGTEKGTYQHPEFYGFGPERGMNYTGERDRADYTPQGD